MSFILDALKKLERNRQRSSVPDLLTDHRAVFSGKEKRSVWPYLIIAALILNALVLSLWLRSTNTGNLKIAQVDVVQKPVESSVKKATDEPDPATPPSLSKTTDKTDAGRTDQKTALIKDENIRTEKPSDREAVDIEAASEPADKPESSSKSEITTEVSMPIKEETAMEQVTADKTDPALGLNPTEKELKDLREKITEERETVLIEPDVENLNMEDLSPSHENRIPELSELTSDKKKNIPKITISGHIFSNDRKSRIVNINGSIFREGETVSTDLKLEEITITGVILNFDGTRFKIRAF